MKTMAGEEAIGLRSVSGHYGQSAFGMPFKDLCSLKTSPHLVVPFGMVMGLIEENVLMEANCMSYQSSDLAHLLLLLDILRCGQAALCLK